MIFVYLCKSFNLLFNPKTLSGLKNAFVQPLQMLIMIGGPALSHRDAVYGLNVYTRMLPVDMGTSTATSTSWYCQNASNTTWMRCRSIRSLWLMPPYIPSHSTMCLEWSLDGSRPNIVSYPIGNSLSFRCCIYTSRPLANCRSVVDTNSLGCVMSANSCCPNSLWRTSSENITTTLVPKYSSMIVFTDRDTRISCFR